jgi:predicted DNA-binding transcriptional regulator AlpA
MKLLKPSEVADVFGVKESTLEAWRSRGTGPTLPFVKVGHAVRYRATDVERVIADGLRDREDAA